MMSVVHARGWPGRDRWHTSPAPGADPLASSRTTLYLTVLPHVDNPDAFTGFYERVSHGRRMDAGWIVPNAMAPAALAAELGDTVLSVGDFFRADGPMLAIYRGQGAVAGFDLARSFALLAERYWQSRRGGWGLGFEGWGVWRREKSSWSMSTRRPVLSIDKRATFGAHLEWTEARSSLEGSPGGSYEDGQYGVRGRHWRGSFLDLLPASYALSGVERYPLNDHLRAWGIPAVGPDAAPPGAEGCAHVRAVHGAVRELAGRVHDAAGGISLDSLHSPGTLASRYLTAWGARHPLSTSHDGLDDAELDRWMAGYRGGLVSAPVTKEWVPVIDVDQRGAFPTNLHLVSWWEAMTAERFIVVDAAEDFLEHAHAILADPERHLLDPATVRHMGLTRVTLRLEGEEARSTLAPQPGWWDARVRQVFVPTSGVYECPWPEAVAIILRSGRVPEVLEAKKVVAVGGSTADDPLWDLRERRQVLKTKAGRTLEDEREIALLRLVANSVYGQFGRIDPPRLGKAERPVDWCFPPLFSVTVAMSRMWCELLGWQVRSAGGAVVYEDTDGCAVHGLERWQVQEILDRYKGLVDGDFWSIEVEGNLYAWGRRKYVVCEAGGAVLHGEIGIDAVTPPGWEGRTPKGNHAWIAHLLPCLARGENLPDPASWPHLQVRRATSPEVLATLPKSLGLRPFGRYLQAVSGTGSPTTYLRHPGAITPDILTADWTSQQGQGALGGRTVGRMLREWARSDHETIPGSITLDPLLTRRVAKEEDDRHEITQDLDRAAILAALGRAGLRPKQIRELTGVSREVATALMAGAWKGGRPSLFDKIERRLAERRVNDPWPHLVSVLRDAEAGSHRSGSRTP